MLRIVRTAVLTAAICGAGSGLADTAGAQQSGTATPAASDTAPDKKPKAAKKAQSKPKGGDEASGGGDNADAALDKARRALAEGKFDAARALAEAVLGAGQKEPRNMARALAIRGEARLGLGKLAEAISDLDSALWVKGGLAGSDREAAVAAKSQAMQQSGLAAADPPATRPARPLPAQAEERRASRPSPQPTVAAAAAAPVSPAPAPAPPPQVASAPKPAPIAPSQPETSGGGIGSFFANLFASGKPAERQGTAPSTTGSVTGSVPKSPQPATSSFAPQRSTEPARKQPPASPSATSAERRAVAGTPTAVHTASIPAPDAKPEAPSPAAGGYRLQLAAVRTKDEATDMMQRVRREEAALLGNRTYEIAEDVYGSMGRFYRVRIGPFAEPTEALAICSALRQKRLDCMVLDR